LAETKTKAVTFISHKFWMGFNGFVLLFLGVNIATIGVEIDSRIPFLAAFGYLVYLFIYLSRGDMWKLIGLFIIAVAGALFYLAGMISGLTGSNIYHMAWTQVILSLILLGGAFAHLRTRK
jgi:hypothetical protein